VEIGEFLVACPIYTGERILLRIGHFVAMLLFQIFQPRIKIAQIHEPPCRPGFLCGSSPVHLSIQNVSEEVMAVAALQAAVWRLLIGSG
jgi:hypothetical protein